MEKEVSGYMLRLNSQRLVSWFIYNVCREKRARESRVKKKMSDYKFILISYTKKLIQMNGISKQSKWKCDKNKQMY
jgi:hypothetical protein